MGGELKKAESIEQIREHLARGGMVENCCSTRVISVDGIYLWCKPHRGGVFKTAYETYHWNLLPLEEKEPVTLMGQLENAGVRAYYGSGEPADHGTQDAIDASFGAPIPNQHLLSILRGTATMPACVSAQGYIYHKAQLEAAEVIERQQKRIEELEAQSRRFLQWFNLDGSPCDGFRFREEEEKLRKLVGEADEKEPVDHGVIHPCEECGEDTEDGEPCEACADGTQKNNRTEGTAMTLEKDFYRQAALQHCQQEGFDPAEVLDERTGRTRLTQLSLDLEILDMQLAALRMAHTLKLKEQGQ